MDICKIKCKKSKHISCIYKLEKVICITLFIKDYNNSFKNKYENNGSFLLQNILKYYPGFEILLFTDGSYT
jgi:hypothetical protein